MEREVYLVGSITSDTINRVMEEILRFFKENPEEEIVLLISSCGGSGRAAITFYEWVRFKNIPLTTVAIGEVSSAAVIVFLSGKRRKATSHSWFALHKGGSLKGDIVMMLLRVLSPSRYRDEADWGKMYKLAEKEITRKETKFSQEEIEKALEREHLILNAEEAKKYGLIDEIIP
jgi:ATP-dependent Clp protease protease subunit